MIYKNTLTILVLTASVISGLLAQAAFTPTFVLSILLFISGFAFLLKRRFKTGLALFIINGLALYGVSQISQ